MTRLPSTEPARSPRGLSAILFESAYRASQRACDAVIGLRNLNVDAQFLPIYADGAESLLTVALRRRDTLHLTLGHPARAFVPVLARSNPSGSLPVGCRYSTFHLEEKPMNSLLSVVTVTYGRDDVPEPLFACPVVVHPTIRRLLRGTSKTVSTLISDAACAVELVSRFERSTQYVTLPEAGSGCRRKPDGLAGNWCGDAGARWRGSLLRTRGQGLQPHGPG